MTALMWAAFNGRTEQVRALLEKGADPALRDMDGMTAAHWSIQRHDTRVLQVSLTSTHLPLHHNDVLTPDTDQFRECSVCGQQRKDINASSS